MTRHILLMPAMLAAGLALAACAHGGAEPEIRAVEKRVPVVAPCVSDKVPHPPAYVDSDEALKAAPSAAERLKLVLAGRVQRIQRGLIVEPVIETCRMPTHVHDGP